MKYQYRYYNDDSVQKFQDWIVAQNWEEVASASGSNSKTEIYQKMVDAAIQECFPLITMRRKSTDLPWINAGIRRLIRRRKAIYKREGRSAAWKKLKKKTDRFIKFRKGKYEESQKLCLLADDAIRHFWKNCKTY